MAIKSIIQQDDNICFLCGEPAGWDSLDVHHCFNGALRKKSDKLGLTVRLHHNKCHQYGKNAAHRNTKTMQWIKQQAQLKAMERYGWTVEDFRREFYKNYLEEAE